MVETNTTPALMMGEPIIVFHLCVELRIRNRKAETSFFAHCMLEIAYGKYSGQEPLHLRARVYRYVRLYIYTHENLPLSEFFRFLTNDLRDDPGGRKNPRSFDKKPKDWDDRKEILKTDKNR